MNLHRNAPDTLKPKTLRRADELNAALTRLTVALETETNAAKASELREQMIELEEQLEELFDDDVA